MRKFEKVWKTLGLQAVREGLQAALEVLALRLHRGPLHDQKLAHCPGDTHIRPTKN